VAILKQAKKLFPIQFGILQNRPQEPRRQIVAPMHGHNRRSAIGVPEIEMAALLAEALKTDTFEEPD
jgi:hypothetical protein